MAEIKIRELLDVLPGEAVKRLCTLQGVTGRSLDERCEALARSYRGDHAAFLNDLRKKDLVFLLATDTTFIDDTEYFLPRATSYSPEELVRIAKKAFSRDGVPSEFVALDEDDEDDGSGSGDHVLTVADVRASPGDFAFLFEHPDADRIIREASPQTTLDEIVDRIIRQRAKPPIEGTASGSGGDAAPDLAENEMFFLQFSGLKWPVTIEQATVAYRTGVLMLHPDRHAPAVADTANSTLRRFKDGFEALKKRL